MRVGLQVGPSAVENLLDTTKSSPHGRGGTPGSPSPAHRARDTSKKHGAGTGDPSITETRNGPLRGVARTAGGGTSAPLPRRATSPGVPKGSPPGPTLFFRLPFPP